eukprot:756311-Hanusia_phi.AAC.1
MILLLTITLVSIRKPVNTKPVSCRQSPCLKLPEDCSKDRPSYVQEICLQTNNTSHLHPNPHAAMTGVGRKFPVAMSRGREPLGQDRDKLAL